MHLIMNMEDIKLLKYNKYVDKILLNLIEEDFIYMLNQLNRLGIIFNLQQKGVYILYERTDTLKELEYNGIDFNGKFTIEFVDKIYVGTNKYIKVLILKSDGYGLVIYSKYEDLDEGLRNLISEVDKKRFMM